MVLGDYNSAEVKSTLGYPRNVDIICANPSVYFAYDSHTDTIIRMTHNMRAMYEFLEIIICRTLLEGQCMLDKFYSG